MAESIRQRRALKAQANMAVGSPPPSKRLKEERAVEVAEEEGEPGTVGTFEVEKIVRHKKDRQTGEYVYITKWKGYSSTENTEEPELVGRRPPWERPPAPRAPPPPDGERCSGGTPPCTPPHMTAHGSGAGGGPPLHHSHL